MTFTFKVFRGSPDGKILSNIVNRDLREHEVFIETTHSGVCGTDELYLRSGLVLGHEGIGIVRAVGSSVHTAKVGDQVGFGYIHEICGHCNSCCTDLDQYCRERKRYGFDDHDNGSFSFGAIWDAKCVITIPLGYDPVAAAPLMCAGATIWEVLTRFDVQCSDRVAIMGVGGLGHLAIKLASAMGCEVVVFSGSESKKQEALEYGASEFHVFNSANQPTDFKPVKHLLLCGSSSVDYQGLIPLMDTNSTIYPLTASLEAVPIPLSGLLFNGIKIQGTMVSSRASIRKLLEFCARKNIKPTTTTYPFTEEGVESAMQDLRAGTVRFRAVLVRDMNYNDSGVKN